jgi:dimethylaniline monooxygenase (N-oxide forming)
MAVSATTTVCVIGAGALGLTATKAFLEDGFQVTGFEAREYVGGLWKDSQDATISVHATTVFNSSKWRTAFSDFPFGDEADTYPTATQIHQYLESYANHFGLRDRYQLGTRVLQLRHTGNQWAVKIQSIKHHQQPRTEYFDKVCVATGAFHKPRWPAIDGIAKFQGQILHSINFHGDQNYPNQSILLVGLHATAQDVCCALAKPGNAKHVYMAHRRGVLLLPRFRSDGSTFDAHGTVKMTFIMTFMNKYLPALFWWMMQRILIKQSHEGFPGALEDWQLSPSPSVVVRTPLMADALWPLLKSGFAEPVSSIRCVCGPKSVQLADGRTLDDIDTIIYCTGYHFSLPDGLVSRDSDADSYNPYPQGSKCREPRLYRNVFPMDENKEIRNSLAYLGHGYIPFPGFVQFEMTAAAVSQVWRGKSSLPSLPEMEGWFARHIKRRKTLQERYLPLENSTFYPILLDTTDFFEWIDQAAGTGLYKHLGSGWVNWRAWKLWWEDRAFYNILQTGMFTPAIWRLFETGKRQALRWDECKQIILSENRRAQADQKAKLLSMQEGNMAVKRSVLAKNSR